MELNEGKLKDILEEQREEYQRYLDILKEDFDAKVELFLSSTSRFEKPSKESGHRRVRIFRKKGGVT